MKDWVTMWGVPQNYACKKQNMFFKDITFRFILNSSINGEKIRLCFSNKFGDSECKINSVTIAKTIDEYSIDTSTLKDVTFNGQDDVVIAKGGQIVSDNLDYSIKSGDQISVSIYFKELIHNLTAFEFGTPFPFNIKRFCLGNNTHMKELDAFTRGNADNYSLLYQVDVFSNAKAVVAFGDSITAQTWPDHLTNIFIKNKINKSVVRCGIGGNRILKEYEINEYRHYGNSGIKRFSEDTAVQNADTIIVLHGINDIIHPDGSRFRPYSDLPSLDNLINGLKKYIEIAHKRNQKILIMTLPPASKWYTMDENKIKLLVEFNEWIRQNNDADGFIDIFEALRDKNKENAYLEIYDSGDHLHPSVEGAKKIAESVPLEQVGRIAELFTANLTQLKVR